MNKYESEELFLQSLAHEPGTEDDQPRSAPTARPPETELELKDEDAEGVVRPLSSSVRNEGWNFSDDWQNALLAAYIAHPERFQRFGEIVKPQFFNGVSAVEIMFRLRDYKDRYGRNPNFTELGNYAFRRTERKNPERAAELMEYVLLLSRISLDEAGLSYLSEQAAEFARERAIFDALRKIHLAQQEGKLAEHDPVAVMQAAVRVGCDLMQEPRMEDGADMLAETLEAPPELIRGLLHKGTKLVLGGASKSFKSWSLLDMAVSIACGVPWWNIPTSQDRVLFINFEIPKWAFQRRLEAVCAAKQVTLSKGWFHHLCLRGFAADSDKMLARIEREIGNQKFGLLILDPVYKLLGDRDENAAGDIASLLNGIEALVVKTGAAAAFGAHFSKGNQAQKSSIDRIGGSGVFGRDPDSLLTMTAHEEDAAYSVEPTLRNFKPMEPFVTRWQYPLMTVDNDLNPADLKKQNQYEDKYQPHELAVLLADRPLTPAEWQTKALEELGMSSSTFYRKKKLVKNVMLEEGKYRLKDDFSR